jgi:glycosyltransferase involved in cell wall biosynthesis
MKLDVIVPTYNRDQMLAKTLDSLLSARVPAGMEVRITVVDNNSKDETRRVVEEWQAKAGGRLGYVFEPKQGRSHALNAGIAATAGDLVGMIDDDEEVDATWYETVHRVFSQGGVDFIGGPYVPNWGAEPPSWLPMDYCGVIGWVDGGDAVARYDDQFPGILMGGNAVLTREVLEKVGPYATELGRTKGNLLSGEDRDMHRRLLASGATGYYVPDLKIYHYIPPERLTRRYFRRWSFWHGVSMMAVDGINPISASYVLGVPRWFYGVAARRMAASAREAVRRPKSSPGVFSAELAVWEIVGFFYGKHFYKPPRQPAT